MSAASSTITSALVTAIAVAGTHYDLSGTGRVQVGMFAGPPIGGAFVAVAPGDLATSEMVDLSRMTYRATVIIEGWAPADSGEQSDRIKAAEELRSDLLAALHGAFIDPDTRAAAMRASSCRDVQASSTVMAGELVSDAWAGWGYCQIVISYTADGSPGAY